MSILSFNPLAETQVVEKTIYVTDEIKTPPLPEASTDQIFDELTYSRFHDEKLWVIYPFTGIEIYNTENSRLERVSELQFSSLPFFIDGMEALDVVFFNNVIYIAFINSNSLDPDSGRISILEYNTNFELTEKGYIPTPLTNAIAIANNYLWIGERLSIYSIEGQLSIYDITTPLDPILIQEDIYDFAATELAYLESHHAMAAGIGFDIVFFNSIDSLDIKKAHNQLFSIVKILEIDDKKVACHTLELAGPFSSQFTPHLTIFDQNFDYSNIIKFEYQYPSKGYIFDEIIYTDNTLLISSKRSGLHILDLSLDEPELKAYDPTKVMLMAKSNKIIISNTESTSFYDPKIFSNEWSQIKDWNKH